MSKNTSYNLNIQGYETYHLFGNKSDNARKGRYSGGITVYYKSELHEKIKIVEEKQIGIIWMKLCKSLFNFNTDVYFFVVHIFHLMNLK